MKLIKLTWFDLKRGVRQEWIKFLFAFAVCIACCSLMKFQMDIYQKSNDLNESFNPCLMDFILYNLRGMKTYSPNLSGERYVLPAVWMFNQVMIAFIVGNYPSSSLKGYGRSILINSKSRVQWFMSKILWAASMTVVYYIVLYLATAVFCIFNGYSLSFIPTENITYTFYNVDFQKIYVDEFVLCLVFMPIITSIVASIIQTVLSFMINPYLSFIAIVVLMLSSTYKTTPALIGNCSMIIRTRFVTPMGIYIEHGLIFLSVYLVTALTVGLVYFYKKDILSKT